MKPQVKVDISSSGYDVIASGTVLTYGNDGDITIRVNLSDSNDSSDSNDAYFEFAVVLKFQYEGTGEKQELLPATDGNTITFTCVNFNNSLGTGTSAPIKIGRFQSRRLWMNFWVYTCGDTQKSTQRKVVYSLYLEKGR